MKITLAMVMSADGKTTKGKNSNIYDWTSPEDQEFFFKLIDKNTLIIMGRKTFEGARHKIKLTQKKIRIVLTKHPENYIKERVPGQLEFMNVSPQELIKQYVAKGYKEALLAGGSEIATLFLKEKLVNEIYFTVEPQLFGNGSNVLYGIDLDIQMQLQEVTRLNERGTLLLNYSID